MAEAAGCPFGQATRRALVSRPMPFRSRPTMRAIPVRVCSQATSGRSRLFLIDAHLRTDVVMMCSSDTPCMTMARADAADNAGRERKGTKKAPIILMISKAYPMSHLL